MSETILVVDDEAAIRRMLQRHLLDLGYNVELAMDGVEALGVIARTDIDAIICDEVMPDISGLELLKKVKRDFPRIPFIIMTGMPMLDHLDECLRSGAEEAVVEAFIEIGRAHV